MNSIIEYIINISYNVLVLALALALALVRSFLVATIIYIFYNVQVRSFLVATTARSCMEDVWDTICGQDPYKS